MIFTKIIGNIADVSLGDDREMETIWLPSEDLTKRILRVTTDMDVDHGIQLSDPREELTDGAILFMDETMIIFIKVLPEELIVIQPKDIDEMGVIAHLLGNSHKPIDVKEGTILLQYDPVIIQMLEKQNIDFSIEEKVLSQALRHANFAH
ncbi:urease accessory protein UreE [Enterococcus sp. LJL98]